MRAIREGNSCLLSPGAPDTVRCGYPSLFGEADRWRLGAVGAPNTVWCTPDSPVPLPTVGSATCHTRIARPTVGPADRWLTGQSGAHRTVRCTPDSPVNFSRSRRRKTRERRLRPRQPGAPDTVRCTTGQSGAPDRNSLLAVHSQVFSSLLLSVSNT